MLRILHGIILIGFIVITIRAQVPDRMPPNLSVLARREVLFSVPPVANASKYVFDIQIYKSNAAKPLALQRASDVSAWIEAETIDFGDRITWTCIAQDARGGQVWKSTEATFTVQKASEVPPGMPLAHALTQGISLSVSEPYRILNEKGDIVWDGSLKEEIPGHKVLHSQHPHTRGIPAVQNAQTNELYLFHHTPYSGTQLRLPRFSGSNRSFQVFSVTQDAMGQYLIQADIYANTHSGTSFFTGAQAVMLLDARSNLLKYWDTDALLTPEDADCKGNMTDAFYMPAQDVLYVCFKDLGRIVGIQWRSAQTHAFVQGMAGPEVRTKSRNDALSKAVPLPGTPLLKSVPLDSVQMSQPDKQMMQKRVPRFPNTATMLQPEAMRLLPDNRLAVFGQNTDGKKSDVYGIMIMPLPNTLNYRSRNVRFIPLNDALFAENPAMNFRHTQDEKLSPAMLDLTPVHNLFLHVPKAANAIEVDTTGHIVGSVNMQRSFSPEVKDLSGTLQGLYPVYFAISHYADAGSKVLRIHNLGTTEDTYRLKDAEGRVVSSIALLPGRAESMPLTEKVHSVCSARNNKLIYYIKK